MYTLDGIPLATEPLQKDLGVIISDALKPSAHITSITKKANQRIGLIKRCFSGLNFDKFDRLFKGIIQPILEYRSPVWSPWLTKGIDFLEKVQKRCYNLASDYESHAWLGLAPCPLERRRKIFDLCEVYKYVHSPRSLSEQVQQLFQIQQQQYQRPFSQDIEAIQTYRYQWQGSQLLE